MTFLGKNRVFSQPNVLQLQEVGDFEALNFLTPQNLIQSTKLHLTTEPPIFCRCCVCLERMQSVQTHTAIYVNK